MYRRVFLRGDSRHYRLRYRLSNGPRIYDVSLRTHLKEIADKKADELILEKERELLGIGTPRTLRDAAQQPLTTHIEDFIASLTARDRSKSHVIHTKGRLVRLARDCKWRLLRDVSAEGFNRWAGNHEELSVKTRNEYLAHAVAFMNWAVREGRALHNPLKRADKTSAKGNETFRRRALTVDELVRLVSVHPKRGLAYLVAGCTGLRRREMKQLLWSDVRLDEAKPFIDVRAETTKAKRAAIIPLVPIVANALRAAKARGIDFTGRVFPRGLPSVASLAKDLNACGIPLQDARGFRVDFRALRHTFATALGSCDMNETVRVKLARHSDWRQTDHYTDPASLPLFAEMDKFAALLPSSIPSLNGGKSGPVMSKVDRATDPKDAEKIVDFLGEPPVLAKAVPSWDCNILVPKGGLEP